MHIIPRGSPHVPSHYPTGNPPLLGGEEIVREIVSSALHSMQTAQEGAPLSLKELMHVNALTKEEVPQFLEAIKVQRFALQKRTALTPEQEEAKAEDLKNLDALEKLTPLFQEHKIKTDGIWQAFDLARTPSGDKLLSPFLIVPQWQAIAHPFLEWVDWAYKHRPLCLHQAFHETLYEYHVQGLGNLIDDHYRLAKAEWDFLKRNLSTPPKIEELFQLACLEDTIKQAQEELTALIKPLLDEDKSPPKGFIIWFAQIPHKTPEQEKGLAWLQNIKGELSSKQQAYTALLNEIEQKIPESLLREAQAESNSMTPTAREERRAALVAARPPIQRGWLGSIWHNITNPDEWSDTTRETLGVGLRILQISQHAIGTYQRAERFKQVTAWEAAGEVFKEAQARLPPEVWDTIVSEVMGEIETLLEGRAPEGWERPLTQAARRNLIYEYGRERLVQRLTEAQEAYTKERIALPDTPSKVAAMAGPSPQNIVFQEEIVLAPSPSVTVLREEKAKPAAPPPDDAGTVLERFVERAAVHPVDDKLFLHGVGDLYGKDSGLEGSSPETSWGYRLDLLKDQIQAMEEVARSSGSDTTEAGTASLQSLKLLERKLERALILRKELVASPEGFGAALTERMQLARTEQESFLLPFTWPKHAVALEFVPTELNSWTLRIYNTGEGSEWHSQLFVGTETFSAPFVEIKGVSKESLLNPLFWSGLHDIDHATDSSVGAKNLYYAVRLLVDEQKEEGKEEGLLSRITRNATSFFGWEQSSSSPPLQKSQHSGTCSFRVLDAVFLSFFGQLPTAEHFYWTEKLALLSAYFGQHKEELHKHEVSFRNFKQGLIEFAALSEQLAKKGVITDKEAFLALKKIEPMQLAVEAAQREFELEQISLHTALVNLDFDNPRSHELVMPDVNPPRAGTRDITRVPKDSFSWPNVTGSYSPNALQETLHSLSDQSNLSIEKKEYFAAHRAIQHLMRSLPQPHDAFWEEIPANQVDRVISELSSLQRIFIKAFLHMGIEDPLRGAEVEGIELLTPFKFLTFIDRLGQRTTLEGRAVPNLYDPWLVGILEGERAFFQPLDPLAADEMRVLANYWKSRAREGVPFFSSKKGMWAATKSRSEGFGSYSRRDGLNLYYGGEDAKLTELYKGGLLPSLDWIKEWFAQKGKTFHESSTYRECFTVYTYPSEIRKNWNELLINYLRVFSGGSIYDLKLPSLFHELKDAYFTLYRILNHGPRNRYDSEWDYLNSMKSDMDTEIVGFIEIQAPKVSEGSVERLLNAKVSKELAAHGYFPPLLAFAERVDDHYAEKGDAPQNMMRLDPFYGSDKVGALDYAKRRRTPTAEIFGNSSPELQRILDSLSSSTSEQVWNTLSFFSSHPSLLFKGTKETSPEQYHSLFRRLLFDSHFFLEELLVSQEHSSKLLGAVSKFIAREYKKAVKGEHILPVLFFLRLNRQVEDAVAFVRQKGVGSSRPGTLLDTRQEIDRLLTDKAGTALLPPEFRRALTIEKGTTYLYRVPEDDEQMADLIRAHLTLTLMDRQDPTYYQRSALALRRAYESHIPLLRSSLQDPERRNRILSRAVQELFPTAPPSSWLPYDDFPMFVSEANKLIVDLARGKVFKEGKEVAPSVKTLLKSSLFLKATQNKEVVVFRNVDETSYEADTIDGITYRITRAKSPEQGIGTIYKKTAEGWAAFIDFASTGLPPTLTHSSWNYWMISGKKLLIEGGVNDHYAVTYRHVVASRHAGAGSFQSVASATIHRLDSSGNPTKVILEPIIEGSPLSFTRKVETAGGLTAWQGEKAPASSPLFFIRKIETPEQLLFWRHEETGDPLKLELRRLGISFSFEKNTKGEWEAFCDQLPGAKLAKNQAVRGIGDVTNYIVLERSGKEILLFSDFPYKSQESTLETKTVSDFERRPAGTWAFERGKEGALKPLDEGGRLYHAYLHLHEHDYEEALADLKRYEESLAPYNEREKQLLKRIASLSGEIADHSSLATMISLRAALLLLVHAYDFGEEYPLTPEETAKIQKLYATTLGDVSRLANYALPPDKEHLFLSLLLRAPLPQSVDVPAYLELRRLQLAGSYYVSPPKALEIPLKIPGFSPLFLFKLSHADERKPSLSRPVLDIQRFSKCLLLLKNPNKEEEKKLIVSIFGEGIPDSISLKELFLFAARSYVDEQVKRDSFLYLLAVYERDSIPFTPLDTSAKDDGGWAKNSFKRAVEYDAEALCSQEWVEKMLLLNPQEPRTIALISVPPRREPSFLDPACIGFEAREEPFFPFDPAHLLATLPGRGGLATSDGLATLFTMKTGDTIADRLFQGISQRISSQQEAFPEDTVITDSAALDRAMGSLREGRGEDKIKQLALQESIVRILAKEGPELKRTEKGFLAASKGKLSPTVDDAIRLFLKRDYDAIREANPSITLEEAAELVQQVYEYLALSTKLQRTERVIESYEKMVKEGSSQELVNKLGEELRRIPCYSAEEHPEYLTFEYYLGITLWPKQVSGLDALKISRGKIRETKPVGKAIELLMGSGKTHVLMPLLAEMLADGEQTPILIIPDPLIPTMSRELDERAWGGFGKKLERLLIKRSIPLDIFRLERIQARLSSALTRREPLMMSDSDIHSLFLSFLETAVEISLYKEEDPRKTERLEKIRLYRGIFNQLKQSGVAVVDEVDSVLTVLHSHHFTVGGSEPLAPSFLDGSVSAYAALFATGERRFSGISKEEYQERIKPLLLNKILDPELHEGKPLREFLSHLNTQQKAWVKEFIANSPSPESEQFLETVDPEIQDILAIWQEEIDQLLPLTLIKQGFHHYGSVPEKELSSVQSPFVAMPYHLGQPVSDASFGTDSETINYTIQLCLQHFMGALVDKEVSQLVVLYKELSMKGAELTEDVLERLKVLLGQNASSEAFGDVEKLKTLAQQHLSENPISSLKLIRSHVLSKLKTHPEQLNSTPQLYESLFLAHLAMSGTLWNIDSLPKLFESIKFSDTEEKTLRILWERSPSKVEVIKGDIDTFLQSSNGSLIDAAGNLVGRDPLKIAEQMLAANPSVNGVVFYDAQNRECILERGETTPKLAKASRLPKEQRACFWDIAHTTGSDVPLGITATAKLLFGKHVSLRDLLQAVWRLRQLDRGQSVSFAITAEDEVVIRQVLEQAMKRPVVEELELKHLLLYAAYNQAMRVGDHNYRSFKQQLSGLVISQLLSLTDKEPVSNAEFVHILQGARGLFSERTEVRPYLMAKSRKAQDIPREEKVEADLQGFLHSPALHFLREDTVARRWVNVPQLEQGVRDIARNTLPFLNATITGAQAAGYGRSREVQREVEKETEKEKEKEVEKEKTVVDANELLRREDLHVWPRESFFQSDYWSNAILLSQFFAHWKESYSPSYSPDLIASPNLLPLHLHPDWRAKPYALSQQYSMGLLLIRDKATGHLKMMLLGIEDQKQFRKMLRDDGRQAWLGHRDEEVALYEFNGALTESGSDAFPLDAVEGTREFLLLRAQAKFFAGHTTYTEEEIPLLEKWIKENDPLKMRLHFETKVLRGREFSAEEYELSNLRRLFVRLCK